MKLRHVFASCAAALGWLAFSSSANAITYGELDGEDHPHVGLLIFDIGGVPAWRCSGTLLSPTVMVTAGHCTFGASGGRVWFDTDVDAGRPGNGYPFSGGTAIEFAEIHSHPDFGSAPFFMHDVGVVILSEPVSVPRYGSLPPLGLLDGLATRRGLQQQIFVAVGYGVQSIVPDFQADLVRYQGEVKLVDVKGNFGIPAGTSVTFSNSPGQSASGGTCFGDSGGPVFWGHSDTIAAVTSFGINLNCVGTGGGYRLDTLDDINFVSGFLD
jgi:secreted trypsin-like serine protease